MPQTAATLISVPLDPPLKWAGGKRWLVPIINTYWKDHFRLVEPFAGGLAVTLGLEPDKALVNDVNPHLINFYKQIQNNGLKVSIETLYDEKLFYSYRLRFNDLIRANEFNTSEAAQIFYYLNRTCFNGLCRFNRSGEFNVPFGRYTNINYAKDFNKYKEAFNKWTFKLGDFQKLKIEKNDFIYADPPYDVEFTSYAKDDFLWKDQIRLANWLAKKTVPVIISNQATDRIIDLYKGLGFDLQFFQAPRRISCNGDRSAAREVLAIKNL